MEQQWQPRLDAGQPVGHLPEVRMHAPMLINGGRLHRLALLPARVVKRRGRMVRADHRDRPVGNAPPDFLQVARVVAQGRRADALGALDVARAGPQVLAHEVQVVRTRLGVDGEQAALGVGDVGHGARGGHVHEQDGRIGHLGQGDGAVGGFRLRELRTGDGVEKGARVARLGETRSDGGDHVAVFGVDHGGDAQTTRVHHDVEEVGVAELHGLVGHVQLHGRDAFLVDEPGQLVLEDGLGGVRQDHVEPVVAVGIPGGLFVIGLEGRVDAFFMSFLGGKGDHGSVPTSEGAARAGLPGIACGGVVLLYVDVRVDASVFGLERSISDQEGGGPVVDRIRTLV